MRSSVTKSALNAKINQVDSDQRAKYNKKSEKYDPEFIKNWDFIQKKFRCCGFKSVDLTSLPYDQYKHNFENKCVPKACCINEKDCKLAVCNWQNAATKVFNEGCLTVMQRRYTVQNFLYG